jgi:uroporphyrinogen decarboxylase
MDPVRLKRDYGEKLTLMGGIDVRKMALADPAIIEEEIATKITAAKVGGGYIYHSDHSVPDNISFPQYVHVMELVKKYGAY